MLNQRVSQHTFSSEAFTNSIDKPACHKTFGTIAVTDIVIDIVLVVVAAAAVDENDIHIDKLYLLMRRITGGALFGPVFGSRSNTHSTASPPQYHFQHSSPAPQLIWTGDRDI
ncbi:Hypothetical predicted protein [Octopus vulgaris]|uniref:Uncharacterized protein n=1 Tax=Octopus vulgaris TaxID=6645 RepID=A0AA36F4G9_OCTVU|nr:Hypothetical predicted protein [Octopus vulgaris]